MAWRTARSILTLHSQLRPLAPNAPASAFGTIGDTSHTSTSDHAAKDFPGWGNDIVTAGDFPKAERLDPRAVLEAIRVSRDPRVKYGISNGQMFSSYATSSYPAWTWRPYSGSDGHFTHGHLSVVGDARADGTQPWAIFGGGTVSYTPIDAVHSAVFVGGSSCGKPNQVPEEHQGANDTNGNALVSQASYARALLEELRAAVKLLLERPPARFSDAQVAELVEQVAAALSARAEAAAEAAVRKVLGGLDGATPPSG